MNSFPEDMKPGILVIDDSEQHVEAIKWLLESEGWRVAIALNTTEATNKVNDLIGPTVVLLDRNFKDANGKDVYGEDLLKNLIQRARFPIVTYFLSGDISAEAQIAGLDAGAYGYLVKNTQPQLLFAQVRSAASIVRQLVEPTLDPLTGVHNRRYAHDRIVREIHRSDREGTENAFIMIDVNNLKKVNDTQGHQAGDRLITDVATAIKNHIRPTDIVCRYGGDEFLVFLADLDRNTPQKGIKSFLRDFFQTLASKRITVSVGSSTIPYREVRDVIAKSSIKNKDRDLELDQLIERHIKIADEKMYGHKKKQKSGG